MLLTTVVSFIVVLGVLIAVHEWGHYRMAVACGVKVQRFSIGFGKALWRFKPRQQRPGQDTEFVIGAFPFGGYVKMLDEREGAVAPHERHLAFNTQPLRARALIVAAGPLANLLLAVLLYALVSWIGVQEPRAVLAPPVAGSLAEKAGLQGGDLVRRAALVAEGHEAAAAPNWQDVASFETLRWLLTRGALDRENLWLEVARTPDAPAREVRLQLAGLNVRDVDAQLFRAIGIVSPMTRAEIGEVMPGGAAERAGLRAGDLVLQAGGVAMADGQQLREWIRASARDGTPKAEAWLLERAGQRLTLTVQPELREADGQRMGRIGAYVGAAPEMALVRRGPLQGLWAGAVRVWEVSTLTLRLMGRMLVGELSLKNISGPLTIADYAGKSASLGLTYFLGFMAFVSVSLGVLNLLPLPVLDGGHLMYYLWEAVTGRPVSDAWLERLQRGGMALLLAMMALALFNDMARLLG